MCQHCLLAAALKQLSQLLSLYEHVISNIETERDNSHMTNAVMYDVTDHLRDVIISFSDCSPCALLLPSYRNNKKNNVTIIDSFSDYNSIIENKSDRWIQYLSHQFYLHLLPRSL